MTASPDKKPRHSWETDLGAFFAVIVPLFGIVRGEHAWWIWTWLGLGALVLMVALGRDEKPG